MYLSQMVCVSYTRTALYPTQTTMSCGCGTSLIWTHLGQKKVCSDYYSEMSRFQGFKARKQGVWDTDCVLIIIVGCPDFRVLRHANRVFGTPTVSRLSFSVSRLHRNYLALINKYSMQSAVLCIHVHTCMRHLWCKYHGLHIHQALLIDECAYCIVQWCDYNM